MRGAQNAKQVPGCFNCSLSRQNMSDDDIRLGEEMRTDPNLDFSLLEKLGEG